MTMRPRVCASGRNPDDPMTVPDFKDVYWNGDEIQTVAKAMIGSYQELSWIKDGNYHIVYFWKQKGGMRNGEPVLGVAKKASAFTNFLTDATFVIEMAADHCKKLANYEFEAALFHQLLHLSEREVEDSDPDISAKMIPITRPHELEMFAAEIDRYGFWSIDLRAASQAFHRQLKLDFTTTQNAPRNEAPASFDQGGDEVERRRKQKMADEVTAKGDGVKILYDDTRDEFRTTEGDIYADGAIEEAAGAAVV